MSITVPDIYDNYGTMCPDMGRGLSPINPDGSGGNPQILVLSPTNTSDPNSYTTIIYTLVPAVTYGDDLTVWFHTVMNADPLLTNDALFTNQIYNRSCVTGVKIWIEPTVAVPNWNPTAARDDMEGDIIFGQDLVYDPRTGSGKYLIYSKRPTIRWPWNYTRDVLVVASAYAGHGSLSGYLSYFLSQSRMQVKRQGPGWRGGEQRRMGTNGLLQ